jgi:hypothetical protein
LLWLLATLVTSALAADGWLALVSGRLITHGGLPHHDTLALATNGRDWIDQQWLGQVAEYALAAVGGVRLVLAVNLLLVACAFFAAMAFARMRGSNPATVAMVALLALLPFVVTGMNVRTQSLVYLPFVCLIAFLRRPREMRLTGAAFVLALCAVWANVHGSAVLVASLIALRGASYVATSRSSSAGWALLVGPWACLLASPYHVHLVSYYAQTAFNPTFSTYLSQWAPTRFSPLAAPLLALLFGTIWMLGRSSSLYSRYELCLLVFGIILSLVAVRNWVFGSLVLLMLTPRGFDYALRRRPASEAPAIGALVGAVAAVAALGTAIVALSAPASELTRNYPPEAARIAARAATGDGGTVYAGIPFADWLLWSQPRLAGHVVFDVRYELLHPSEVKRLVLFDAGSGLERPLRRSAVFVLDPDVENRAVSGLRPDVRVLYDTKRAVVAVEQDSS